MGTISNQINCPNSCTTPCICSGKHDSDCTWVGLLRSHLGTSPGIWGSHELFGAWMSSTECFSLRLLFCCFYSPPIIVTDSHLAPRTFPLSGCIVGRPLRLGWRVWRLGGGCILQAPSICQSTLLVVHIQISFWCQVLAWRGRCRVWQTRHHSQFSKCHHQTLSWSHYCPDESELSFFRIVLRRRSIARLKGRWIQPPSSAKETQKTQSYTVCTDRTSSIGCVWTQSPLRIQ